MRIAYLIMAHGQPIHLRRMVNALDREQAAFYIHVDRKVEPAPFETNFAKRDNVRFYWRRLFWGRYFKYRSLMPKRRFPNGMVAYDGLDCLRYVAENPRYKSFFRYTQRPGELSFLTLILNSQWASRVENYAAYQQWSADTAARGEASDLPMLPEESFNHDSRSLFARKFDSRRSSKLLDRIDREILEIAA